MGTTRRYGGEYEEITCLDILGAAGAAPVVCFTSTVPTPAVTPVRANLRINNATGSIKSYCP
ncbi:MAG: hypothetical protein WAU54_10110, partial [Chania sp.]